MCLSKFTRTHACSHAHTHTLLSSLNIPLCTVQRLSPYHPLNYSSACFHGNGCSSVCVCVLSFISLFYCITTADVHLQVCDRKQRRGSEWTSSCTEARLHQKGTTPAESLTAEFKFCYQKRVAAHQGRDPPGSVSGGSAGAVLASLLYSWLCLLLRLNIVEPYLNLCSME